MAVTAETNGATGLSLKRKSTDAPPSSSKKKIRRTFKKVEIDGDGNCLFRAFSQHFNGAENEYEGVRHRIVKYVEKNWEQFHTKVESVLSSRLARSARQYASYMGKDKTFGSEVEILAASLLYKTPIRVYLKKAKRFLPIYQSGDSDGPDIQRAKDQLSEGDANVLYLEYDEDNLHYNVLMPIAVETQVLTSGGPTTSTTPSTSTTSSSTPTLQNASAPKPVSISAASSSMTYSAASSSFASPDLSKTSSQAPKQTEPSLTEPRVTPKALFINKTFDRLENDSILSTASSLLNSSARPVETPAEARGSARNGSRSGTPTRGSSQEKSSSKPSFGRQTSTSGALPIVVRDCYVSLPRTPNSSSRRGSNDSGSFPPSSRQQQVQPHRAPAKSRTSAPPRVMALCLCSTRDPAFISPVVRAAQRHLSQYEVMRKRQTSHRVTRMRGLDPEAAQDSPNADGRVESEVERNAGSLAAAQIGAKTPYSKEIVLWPYLLHSLPQSPNQVFLYHLLFCLFAASQEADEAFTVLARHVFYLQREEIDKYMTAYNLEFTCHTGDTLERILSHYRKSLKRDVAALRKEWVDMYFAHEEIDHPCKPTDLSARQNCVIFVLDSRHEEHQRLLSRLSDHLPYLWKRLSTPFVDPTDIPASVSLQNFNSLVDTVCNDFVDSIIHQHPTRNSIAREVRILTHQISVASENSFQLSVYPKDSLLIDSDVAASQISSLFVLRDRLAELARQSDDLLTFERQQIIGDRVADTHLLEKASSRHRVGICLPTEEWVEASVFFEKALGDLLYSMRTSNSNDADRGFLFLPALNRGRRPFHPFVDGAPLRRLARENNYHVDIFTASPPVKEPVSIVLIMISKLQVGPKCPRPDDEI